MLRRGSGRGVPVRARRRVESAKISDGVESGRGGISGGDVVVDDEEGDSMGAAGWADITVADLGVSDSRI